MEEPGRLGKTTTAGGHRWIYETLLEQLRHSDIEASADRLNLLFNTAKEVQIPFLDTIFLVSNQGVKRADGKKVHDATGSVLIHYILKGSYCLPAGKFITFAELAGPLFKQGSYSGSALEMPIIKRFKGRIPNLLETAAFFGGRKGGESGSGSVSIVFKLLPHILLQLIFYDQDDEFPARATLLFDRNATQFMDFEVFAVLVTLFVQALTRH